MAKKCPLCGNKMGGFIRFKVMDGEICGSCSNLCQSYRTSNIQEMQRLYNKNIDRIRTFTKTGRLKSFMSECVILDDTHKLFCVMKNEKSVPAFVYSYDEINGYDYQEVGGKIVTKNKGGIGRALVGGVLFGGVGAIVGASTSKTESNKVGGTKILNVRLHTDSGIKTLAFSNPPKGFTNFLDRCIDDHQNVESQTLPLTAADEIKKFKQLLDDGILTQDEFNAKKKQLLEL